MPAYNFAYHKIPIPPSEPFPEGQLVLRPLLRAVVTAKSTGKSIHCLVWPDSGADHCVLPLSFAVQMGMDPLTMKRQMTGGVGSAANVTYYGDVTIPIRNGPSITFDVFAGFTQGMDTQGIGLLGQYGFFSQFVVAFNHPAAVFQVVTP